MSSFKHVALMAGIAVLLTVTGCGGGGGGTTVADSVPANARMAAVGSNGDLKIYSMGPGGTVSELQTYNVGFNVVSMARDNASNTFYFGCSNTDGLEFVRFNAQGMVIGQGTAATPNTNVILKKHPNKAVLYALDPANDRVYLYAVNGIGGLTPLNPAFIDVGDSPIDMEFSLDGNSLYLAFEGSSTLGAADVAASGHFTAKANGIIGLASAPRNIVVTPDGKKLFATSAGNQLSQFSLNDTGLPVFANPPTKNFQMGHFRAGASSKGFLALYREGEEGILIHSSNSAGVLQQVGSSYPTNSQMNIFGTPWANTLLFTKKSGTEGEMAIGTDAGAFSKVQDVVMPLSTSDVEFYIAN